MPTLAWWGEMAQTSWRRSHVNGGDHSTLTSDTLRAPATVLLKENESESD